VIAKDTGVAVKERMALKPGRRQTSVTAAGRGDRPAAASFNRLPRITAMRTGNGLAAKHRKSGECRGLPWQTCLTVGLQLFKDLHHEWSSSVAQKIQTLFIDDIDGSEAEGTVRFALDGADYEIDLSVTHSEEFHKLLAPFVAHARKTGGSRKTVGRGRRNAGGVDNHKVREWAREQDIEIKERGRVPADIVEKYRQATGQ
jgi:nucleoid-associated protein Lsr2